MTSLEVLFTPAEFEVLSRRQVEKTACVVFDVLRATSTMVTALHNGASAIMPVASIPEALEARRQQPDVLLAGERDGVRIPADLTGGVAFDLGNSPREFTRDRVAGRTIVMTTTNGTRALRACAAARMVLACSFLNLGATAALLEREKPSHLMLVCSGTLEEAAYEDALGAGALCELLWATYGEGKVADSARIAHNLFLLGCGNLAEAVARSRNARRLLSLPELRDDVEVCLRRDSAPLVAELNREGLVFKRG